MSVPMAIAKIKCLYLLPTRNPVSAPAAPDLLARTTSGYYYDYVCCAEMM